jgi:aconitate hydratase
MSPALVVAYAIAGTLLTDMETEPLGTGADGTDVYLRDIWPRSEEVESVMRHATDPGTFRRLYGDFTKDNDLWDAVSPVSGTAYDWPASTYIAEPPFFADFFPAPGGTRDIAGARALGIFGDSVTTDHISPAGPISEASPAGAYLIDKGVSRTDFQSYGTRRGNHDVMIRGTFANVRIKNLMLPPREDGTRVEGGMTRHQPSGEHLSIYEAAMKYLAGGVPTVVFGGEEYGTGSSRDWAAKGTLLLGVRAVIARSFERIHRSNLVGMGVLPLEFREGDSAQSLGIEGGEEYDILGLADLSPRQEVTLVVTRKDGSRQEVRLLSRIDTAVEVEYYRHGGILPYVLRELIAGK